MKSWCNRVEEQRRHGDFGILFITTQICSFCTQLGSEQSKMSFDNNLLRLRLKRKVQLRFLFSFKKV